MFTAPKSIGEGPIAMKVFVVLAHPEHQSFNGAMFRTAVETLASGDTRCKLPISTPCSSTRFRGRHNFITVKDPNYFKQQIDEMHATEAYGFADDIEREMQKIEWCDLMIWQFPLWWFGLPGILKGWSTGCLPWGGPMAAIGSTPKALSRASARCWR
jgi:NAD(P)H dehydrogenase (quinone)